MKEVIEEFSGTCITSIKNWHSSTVEFKFKPLNLPFIAPLEETGDEPVTSLTLDFCIWDLVENNQLLVEGNDEELETKLAVLMGDTISRISQMIRFSSVEKNDTVGSAHCLVLKVTFGSGKKLFIAPHTHQNGDRDDCGDTPLMTLQGRSSKLVYLENGGMEFSKR